MNAMRVSKRILIFMFTLTVMPATVLADGLVLGFVPNRTVPEVQLSGSRLAEALAGELQQEVSAETSLSYASLALSMKQKRVDIAFVGPFNYLKIADLTEVEPITIAVRRNSPVYYGIVIVKKGAGINSLSDLKGKSISLGDKLSTSSHVYPMYDLEKALSKDSGQVKTMFLSSTSARVLSVLNGRVDAAAIYEDARLQPDILEKYPQVLEQTQVIYRTEAIPSDPQIVRSDLGKELISKIQNAMVKISESEEGRQWLKTLYGIDRLEPITATAYQDLRDKLLRIDPTLLKSEI